MKIAIIGSTQYKRNMKDFAECLEFEGHEVRIPAFNDHPEFNELEICMHNKSIIEWADEVRMIWDRRSVGTIFDFGMVFALNKPFKIEYLEPKTLENVMKAYQQKKEKGE